MRLVVDARYVRPVHDGISRYTAELLHALKRRMDRGAEPGLRVAMLVSDEAQLTQLPDLPRIPGGSPTGPLEPLTSWRLNRYRPDVLFSPMQTVGGVGRRFPLVLTLHDLIYYEHPRPPGFLPAPVRLGWRLFHTSYAPQRLLLNRADAVVTVSETTRRLMAEHRLTRRPVHVISNAPPADAVCGEEEALARIPGRGDKLLYMGSAMPYKRVERLVREMGRLPEHELHLLSRFPPQRAEELRALVPPGARVVFHDGVTDAAYRELLRECRALVTVSASEGYGLPVVEAMAAGAPVVVSDIEIFREIAPGALHVDAEEGGFARAVRSLSDPGAYRARVLAAVRDAGRYRWDDSAARLVELARGVVR
ncbi:glycosyltransferase family 4 protein [Rothia sp. AR01]|uniref:Glycosyltransferase family 4 protein n=1 Tax=Rothia santali TaxID=2949643 RepID=A0A9X2KJ78_9MICC|nr:glycosyltransferase family 1 protein [Rothia santali]MCP3426820.1 glycosyltransferase family 4 protein [Rothia santali]